METLSTPLGDLTTEELGWLSLTQSEVHQKALYKEMYLNTSTPATSSQLSDIQVYSQGPKKVE